MAARKSSRTLLDLCDAAGLSAASLAAQLGVGASTVYAWNAGPNRPEAASVASIAAALGVTEEAVEAVLAPKRKRGAPRKH